MSMNVFEANGHLSYWLSRSLEVNPSCLVIMTSFVLVGFFGSFVPYANIELTSVVL